MIIVIYDQILCMVTFFVLYVIKEFQREDFVCY